MSLQESDYTLSQTKKHINVHQILRKRFQTHKTTLETIMSNYLEE